MANGITSFDPYQPKTTSGWDRKEVEFPVQQSLQGSFALQPRQPTEYGFDEEPTPVYMPEEFMSPEDYQREVKYVQDRFFSNFASQFNKRSFQNADDYKQWVNSLPQAMNPLIYDYVTNTAKKYMPKRIKAYYAAEQADIESSAKMARQIRDAMMYARFTEQAQQAGKLPKGYYYDVKEGGLKFNPKMLPSLNDPVNRLRNKQRSLRFKIEQASKSGELDKIAPMLQQWDELDRQIDQSYMASNSMPNDVDAYGAMEQNPELAEYYQAIAYAQENPNDAQAQQAAQIAMQALQDAGVM